MKNRCTQCKIQVEEWNKKCGSCGYTLVLEPDEARRVKYLRGPSLGALFFTQGWAFGARLYLWFALSLIPIVGVVVLVLCVLFGRRWSWKYGGWLDWEEFTSRMRLLDGIGLLWVFVLLFVYAYVRLTS